MNLLKKITVYLLLIITFIILSSCSKPAYVSTVEPEKNMEIELQEVKDLQLERQLKKPPLPPKKEDSVKPDENKIYYKGKAVVMTYHHISKKPVSSITIKPERFEADLKMLRDNNFNVISYREMIKGMQGEIKFPPNAVVITFDDGYESFYKYAYPLLRKYNMPAVNFVITSWTEGYTPSDGELNPLGPDEIREMYGSGLVDIQSHSYNGHDYIIRNEKNQNGGMLAFQKYDVKTGTYESVSDYSKRVFEDLSKSIPIIQKYTNVVPDSFCFPFGHYNSRLVEIGERAGFKYFITTVSGSNRENSKSKYIYRIRSGDVNLSPEILRNRIIECGSGKPATP